MKQTAADILDKAAGHMRDRAATYDKPEGERSMVQTVDIFNRFHGTTLTEAQGWHFLQVMKDVRLFTRTEYHQDSAEDCVAYAALKAEAMSWQDVGTSDDGWIEWAGGVCPVPEGTLVEVQFRNGGTHQGIALKDLGLRGTNGGRNSTPVWPAERPSDIVRYRVLS